ncbi:LuxR C-terminal-related transcriptional regulator [Streptomyces massasporeus]|uniref:LuxR C-terminal-related transcriptional regulator n=1 Tax=Streptomyces massasporeus TaxID=67324 RepID=UPI00380E4C30
MSTTNEGAPAWRRPWPLLGRDRELELAGRALRDPACHGVLVTGPFGTGRSRLAQEVWCAAGRRGHPRLHASATPVARSVPFGALAPLLGRGPDGAPGLVHGAGSADRPKPVLFLDDAPYLDPASARLVAESMHDGRLLVVTTSDPRGRLPWEEHALASVGVKALPAAVTEQVLRNALGGAVERRTARLLHRATGGRPRDLEEVLDGALKDDALTWDGMVWRLTGTLTVTAGLRALTQSRLRPLDPCDRELLERVAVCGRLACGSERLTGAKRLVRDGWVRALTEGPRRVLELTGDLHREALLSALPSQRVRRILREELERVPAPGSGPGDLLERARWRLAAAEPFDPQALEEALRVARSVPDHGIALQLARELEGLRPGPASGLALAGQLLENGRPQEARAVLTRVAQGTALPGQKARAAVLRAQHLVGELRDADALSVIGTARNDCTDTHATALLDAAEAALRSRLGDMTGAAAALTASAPHETAGPSGDLWRSARIRCLTESGRTKDAVRLVRHTATGRAAPEADPATLALPAEADPATPALLAGTETHALAEAGQLVRAEQLARDGYDRAVDSHAVRSLTWPAEQLGRLHYLQGRLDEARTWYATALAHGREAGLRSGVYLGMCGLALVAAVCADVGAAEHWREQARTLGAGEGWHPEAVLAGAWLAAVTGRTAEARQQLRRAVDDAARRGLHSAQALLWCDVARLGDVEAAVGPLSRLAVASDSALTAARADFARSLASADPVRLEASAAALESLGTRLLAAEAWNASAAAHIRADAEPAARAAVHRAMRLTCRDAEAATPGLVAPAARLRLTTRETEVALAGASGLSVEDIARALSLAARTVINHLRRIRSKLGVKDTGDLRAALFPRPLPLTRP